MMSVDFPILCTLVAGFLILVVFQGIELKKRGDVIKGFEKTLSLFEDLVKSLKGKA